MPDTDLEDDAIDLLILHLNRSGHTADLRDRPDRRKPKDQVDGLTVDALIEIDGEPFAVDVVRATLSGDDMRATDAWHKRVLPLLEKAAQEEGVKCEVRARPPDPVLQRAQDQEEFVMAARRAMRRTVSGPAQMIEGSKIEATVSRDCPDASVLRRVYSSRSYRIDPDEPVHENLSRSLGEALRKKLRGQLKRARALGYPTGILIDQRYDPVHWLAHPGNFRLIVHRVLAQEGAALDAAWVIAQSGKIIDLLRETA